MFSNTYRSLASIILTLHVCSTQVVLNLASSKLTKSLNEPIPQQLNKGTYKPKVHKLILNLCAKTSTKTFQTSKLTGFTSMPNHHLKIFLKPLTYIIKPYFQFLDSNYFDWKSSFCYFKTCLKCIQQSYITTIAIRHF